jgi:hypothetical protein
LAISLDSEDECRKVVKRLCDEFALSDAAREVELTVQFEAHMGSVCEVTQDKRSYCAFRRSWLRKRILRLSTFWILLISIGRCVSFLTRGGVKIRKS